MTREEISALLTRRRQAYERRDIIALANLYSETGIVESPMAGGSVTGRVAIAELCRAMVQGVSRCPADVR